jgi:hypothetical protein
LRSEKEGARWGPEPLPISWPSEGLLVAVQKELFEV